MNERTDVVLLLDRSGSMQSRRADHEGGMRSFLADLQKLGGDVRLTLIQFDSQDPFEVVFRERPVGAVTDESMVLIPRGGTPLCQAVGRMLALAAELPGQPILMIVTDGEETERGTEWTKGRVRAALKEREAAGATVLYLGANVDEFEEAAAIGIAPAASLGYSDKSGLTVSAMYNAAGASLSRGIWAQRAGLAPSASAAAMSFTADERLKAKADPDGQTHRQKGQTP